MILSNISFRCTASFIREVMIFHELYNNLGVIIGLLLITVFITSILSLWLLTRVQYGISMLLVLLDISRLLTYNLGIYSYIILILSLNMNIFSNLLY